jgi:hypothetical protein
MNVVGTFSDGSGSANYLNNALCEWMIAPAGAAQITIQFTAFSTQPFNDVVRVFQCSDVYCSQQQQLAELSGTYPGVKTITSMTGYMKVVFTSDNSVNYDGFTASWSSVCQTCTCYTQVLYPILNLFIFAECLPMQRLRGSLWAAYICKWHALRRFRLCKVFQQRQLRVDYCTVRCHASHNRVHSVQHAAHQRRRARVPMLRCLLLAAAAACRAVRHVLECPDHHIHEWIHEGGLHVG